MAVVFYKVVGRVRVDTSRHEVPVRLQSKTDESPSTPIERWFNRKPYTYNPTVHGQQIHTNGQRPIINGASMLEGILKDLPVNVAKFNDSQEFKRLLTSIHNNLKQDLRNPDSGIGLAINALAAQLSNKDSIVMNESDFTFMERQLLSTVVQTTFDKLKGNDAKEI